MFCHLESLTRFCAFRFALLLFSDKHLEMEERICHIKILDREEVHTFIRGNILCLNYSIGSSCVDMHLYQTLFRKENIVSVGAVCPCSGFELMYVRSLAGAGKSV